MKRRNGEIELLRFIFSCIIMIYHYDTSYDFGMFKKGFFGVEFFFCLSGLLMAQSADKRLQKDHTLNIASDNWHFIKRKIFAFYKYYIGAIVIQTVFRRIIAEHWTVFNVFKEGLLAIPAIFLFEFAGFRQGSGIEVGGAWYLSVMILGMFWMYPLLLKNYTCATKLIFPILGLWVLGFMYAQINGISALLPWFGFAYGGLLRGIGEMALGASCYQAAVKLKEIKFTKISIAGMQILKTACYIAVFYYAYSNLGTKYQIHMFVLLLCAIAVSYSFDIIDGTKHKKIYGLCLWLGKLSLPLYLIHSVVKGVALAYMGTDVSIQTIVLLMLGSVVAAVMLLYGTDWIVAYLGKFKRYFIQSDVK